MFWCIWGVSVISHTGSIFKCKNHLRCYFFFNSNSIHLQFIYIETQFQSIALDMELEPIFFQVRCAKQSSCHLLKHSFHYSPAKWLHRSTLFPHKSAKWWRIRAKWNFRAICGAVFIVRSPEMISVRAFVYIQVEIMLWRYVFQASIKPSF